MPVSVFVTGLMTGFSLIIAIGAQNAFVLRQGLRGEHVLAVCLACALSDAVLIFIGVTGFGQITEWLPGIAPVMRYAGAAFLIWYGIKSMMSALKSSQALIIGTDPPQASLRRALTTCLALTWLNPHVYLDTVVLLGTIATRFNGARTAFGLGAMTASVVFFFALGYGAAWLRPIFARPGAWRVLEMGIACVMWAIAAKLLWGN